jgi:hypothetical protein
MRQGYSSDSEGGRKDRVRIVLHRAYRMIEGKNCGGPLTSGIRALVKDPMFMEYAFNLAA